MDISVIVATHNPHLGRLQRTFAGLGSQTLATNRWELILVDNASTFPPVPPAVDLSWHPHACIVREPQLGLTAARLRGFATSSSEVLVMVDDDNVLAPDYLEQALDLCNANPRVGAAGGITVPDFEAEPATWVRKFDSLLALRNLGQTPLRADWSANASHDYPTFAPVGAGLVLRRQCAAAYANALERDERRRQFDRTGRELVSGGDNDLVMTALEAGYSVMYSPNLTLTHLIPAARCTRQYLGALNRAIARSWVSVLALHHITPWRPIAGWTVGVRSARAWLRNRAWRSPEDWVTWQGMCGHFAGRADLGYALNS